MPLFPRYFRSTAIIRHTSLRWQQSSPQQIQIREREGGIQSRGVLRQSAVANLVKAPQALDHVEHMLDTGPGGRAATVDESSDTRSTDGNAD